MTNETIVIDTQEGIVAYHLLAQRGAMRLELRGLRHSRGRSVIAHVKRTYGFKGNREAVFAQFETMLREKGILKGAADR